VKLSLIGHSLGGLIIRYCIGLMKNRNTFDLFIPHIYMTFATPHLGSRRSTGFINSLIGWYTKSYIDKTGKELLLEDGNPPLLKILSDPQQEYFQALESFKYRIIYSNIRNDIPVPFCSSAIIDVNPYPQNINEDEFLIDYPHIIKESKIIPDTNIDYSLCFIDDEKGEDLRYILFNLHLLEWKRYDVLFSHILAHEMIIYKKKLIDGLDGKDIAYHARHLFKNQCIV